MDTTKIDKPVPESTKGSTASQPQQSAPTNELLNKGPQHSKHALRFILTYVALIILALIIGFGVHWYHDHHSKLAKNISGSIQTQKTKPSLPATNPYAGWKQYCDDSNKVCYKYPAGWVESQSTDIVSSTTTYVESQVQSPDKGVNSIYSYPYFKDANNFSFLTMDIESVPGYPNLKVVGGVYLNGPGGASNYVQYAVVDKYLVTEDKLAVGKTSQFINTARFALGGNFSDTTAGEKDIYQFIAMDAQSNDNTAYTLTQAKNWFSTQDAKDSALMLESLSPEQISSTQTFFTCLASNGALSKQGPETCTIDSKTYSFPSTYSTADVVNYDKVSAGAQSLVSSLAQKNFNGCLQLATTGKPYTNYPLTTVDIATTNFVSVSVSNCDSGYFEDFGLQGTSWADLGSRQVDLSCNDVTKYGITQTDALANNAGFTNCMTASGTEQPIPQ